MNPKRIYQCPKGHGLFLKSVKTNNSKYFVKWWGVASETLNLGCHQKIKTLMLAAFFITFLVPTNSIKQVSYNRKQNPFQVKDVFIRHASQKEFSQRQNLEENRMVNVILTLDVFNIKTKNMSNFTTFKNLGKPQPDISRSCVLTIPDFSSFLSQKNFLDLDGTNSCGIHFYLYFVMNLLRNMPKDLQRKVSCSSTYKKNIVLLQPISKMNKIDDTSISDYNIEVILDNCNVYDFSSTNNNTISIYQNQIIDGILVLYNNASIKDILDNLEASTTNLVLPNYNIFMSDCLLRTIFDQMNRLNNFHLRKRHYFNSTNEIDYLTQQVLNSIIDINSKESSKKKNINDQSLNHQYNLTRTLFTKNKCRNQNEKLHKTDNKPVEKYFLNRDISNYDREIISTGYDDGKTNYKRQPFSETSDKSLGIKERNKQENKFINHSFIKTFSLPKQNGFSKRRILHKREDIIKRKEENFLMKSQTSIESHRFHQNENSIDRDYIPTIRRRIKRKSKLKFSKNISKFLIKFSFYFMKVL